MDKPPHYLKLWLWLLMKARWKDGDKLLRGQVLTTIAEMQEVGGFLRGNCRTRLSPDEVRSAYGYLIDSGAITKQKTTRGMIITITNYDLYQPPQSYETGLDIPISETVPNPAPDTAPDPTPEHGVTPDEAKGNSNQDAGGTPHRTPRRKRAGPRITDEEGKEGNNIVATTKTTSSDHRLFSAWWCYVFELLEGDKYVFEGGKDGRRVKEMLQNVSVKELVAKGCHYLIDSDRFPKGRPTIAGLNTGINKYPSTMNGKTDLFRTRGMLPPEGVMLEEWSPWEGRLKSVA